jgi:hypothetical protein
MAIGIERAVMHVQDYFREQCGNVAQAHWEVLAATEDIAKGVYVIRCREKCCFDQGGIRSHEVWVNIEDGVVCHQHRIKDGDGKD